LEELNQLKPISSTAVHELRTPLTLYPGASANLIARQDDFNNASARYLTLINEQALHFAITLLTIY